MNSFDDAYIKSDGYFGEQPEKILVTHLAYLDKGLPVLDIGSGQGRHALYLGGEGFTVDALDHSGTDFEVIHSWEGLGHEHRHGDGPLERHGLAAAVFRRR